MNKNNCYCVIMAGGAGTRFWPVSRTAKPKQFLDVADTGKTFIRYTYDRMAKVLPKENILIVTAAKYRDLVMEQIPELEKAGFVGALAFAHFRLGYRDMMDKKYEESRESFGKALSLVGTDEESNAARAGVPFSRVEEAVRLLQAARKKHNAVHLEIHLAYLMLASNVEAVRGLPKLMEEWGVHAVVVSTMDYIPSPEMEHEAFAPHEREKIEAARVVLEEVGAQVRAMGRDFFASLPAAKPAPCCRERAHRTLYADASGEISPCVYLNVPIDAEQPRRTVFGQVNDTDPVSIWELPDYQDFRRAVETADPPAACVSCAKRFEAPCAE